MIKKWSLLLCIVLLTNVVYDQENARAQEKMKLVGKKYTLETVH